MLIKTRNLHHGKSWQNGNCNRNDSVETECSSILLSRKHIQSVIMVVYCVCRTTIANGNLHYTSHNFYQHILALSWTWPSTFIFIESYESFCSSSYYSSLSTSSSYSCSFFFCPRIPASLHYKRLLIRFKFTSAIRDQCTEFHSNNKKQS